ncbi:MAG: CHAD domain-containing protein, partial [Halioglobus sp.]|nr:CHAD domain-containing protein [Halioglobus sp.]
MPTISKSPAPVDASQTASEAFATILRYNFDYLIQWEDTARSADEIEGVHQLRVTFRRMRSALVLFRSAVPKSASAYWNGEMRWLASQLGLARDLDVFLTESLKEIEGKLPLGGSQKLIALTDRRRRKVYRDEVCTMLDSERFARFKTDFVSWVAGKEWEKRELKKKQLKYLEMELPMFAGLLMDKQERRVLNHGSHVAKDSPEEMHRLRIECKKLRYAAEF